MPSGTALFGSFWQIEADHAAALAPLAKNAILGVLGRALLASVVFAGHARLPRRAVVVVGELW